MIYTEIPLPEGITVKSEFPGLQDSLYLGSNQASPVLFASTKSLPLAGQTVTQRVNMNDLDAAAGSGTGTGTLLFVVSSTGPIVGTLANALPWILAWS